MTSMSRAYKHGKHQFVSAVSMIDKLYTNWLMWESNESYYMDHLVPAIVNDEASDLLSDDELELVSTLKRMMHEHEWICLGDIIAARRAGNNMALESDDARFSEFEKQQKEEDAKRIRLEREMAAAEQAVAEEEERKEAERLALEQRAHEARVKEEAEQKALKLQQKHERRKRRKAKSAQAERFRSLLTSDYLSADEIFSTGPGADLLSDKDIHAIKVQFIQEWAHKTLELKLDSEQASAVGSHGGDIQVIARAGSGKTRVLVTRAIFLQKHCRVSPREIVLLAFNKSAVLEVRERLADALGDDIPHVLTFHALAYALVHPDESIIFDDPSSGSLTLSRSIQGIIDDHLRSKRFRPIIRDTMLMHFQDDWDRIVEGGHHLSHEEYIEYRNALPRETLRGDYVKSYGEKLVANTLFRNDIDYHYEYSFRWGKQNYRPDFMIPVKDKMGVIIEYFGMTGDADYDQMSSEKRRFWSKNKKWTLLEYTPDDIKSLGPDGFSAKLLGDLSRLGVTGRRLSDDEIWQRVRHRAIDSFTKAMVTFISRCRKKNMSISDLKNCIITHNPTLRQEQLFIKVGYSIYSTYVDMLMKELVIDYDGLMWSAVDLLKQGHATFSRDRGRECGDVRKFRHIMIDEFQDFSQMFYEISIGIRSLNTQVELFCVGDDWQAINGFAGSDLRYCEEFTTLFRNPSCLTMRTNYRSPKSIVELGNALMTGRGVPAEPSKTERGEVCALHLCDFKPTPFEQARHKYDESTAAVSRLVGMYLDRDFDVVMLSRRNSPPWSVCYPDESSSKLDGLERFTELIRSLFPEEDRHRLTASTAHKYKGLENDAVIILDADQGSYPLIHPNWIFLRLFGDSLGSLENEERRLLYVSLTRATKAVSVLSRDENRESPYMGDINGEIETHHLSWDQIPPVTGMDRARYEVRVRNAYDIKDQLKDSGFRWNSVDGYWFQTVPVDDFSFSRLCKQEWAQGSVSIEVYSETGELIEHS